MDDDEFVELFLDNEQPVMQQDQAKRVRNSSSPVAYPSSSDYGQFEGENDDDPVPWTNFCSEDYSPEFFTVDEPGKTVSHPSQQYQSLVPTSSRASHGHGGDLQDSRSQRPVAARSPSSSGVKNFSHYSRLRGHAGASVQSISGPRSGRSASASASGGISSLKVAEHTDLKVRGKNKVPQQDLGKIAGQSTAADVQNLSEIELRADRSPAADVQNILEKDMNAKRIRAADVHNLSERRRRDRINDKIRSLQEMIPNCNKVDKASILDETIEYIKTLQIQLQISTMQNRLLNPLMMSHSGMQLAPMPPMPAMPPLLPMGVGIGRGSGLNYGMGMYDTNSVHHFPFIPVPPTQEQLGPGLHGMQGSTGFPGLPNPGQGLAVPMPGASLFPSSLHLPTNVTPVPSALGVSMHRSPHDQQQQNIDIESTEKRSTK